MATVYAVLGFTDPSGKNHEPGDEFEMPDETPEEQADLSRFLSYGIITRDKPRKRSEKSGSSQRTRPNRTS